MLFFGFKCIFNSVLVGSKPECKENLYGVDSTMSNHKQTSKVLSLIYFLSIFFFLSTTIFTQTLNEAQKGSPVILDGDTLFSIYAGIGTFSAERRAKEVSEELKQLTKQENLNYDSAKIVEQDNMFLIILNEDVLFAVTPADVRLKDIDARNLAEKYKEIIVINLKKVRNVYSPKAMLENLIYTVVYLIIYIFFFNVFIKTQKVSSTKTRIKTQRKPVPFY